MAGEEVRNIAVEKNLNLLNLKSGAKFQVDGKEYDYSALQEMLSGNVSNREKIKVDRDGDGIFDEQIRAKYLKKETPDEKLSERVKILDNNTAELKEKSEKYFDVKLKLENDRNLSEKDIKKLEKEEGKIEKQFEKAKVDLGGFTQKTMSEKWRKETLKKVENEPVKTPVVKTTVEEALKQEPKKEETPSYTKYTVQNGDSPSKIADRFKLKGEEKQKFIKDMLEHNKDDVKTFKGNKTGKPVKGFLVGAEIELSGEKDTSKLGLKSKEEAVKEYTEVRKAKIKAVKEKAVAVAKKEKEAPAKKTETKSEVPGTKYEKGEKVEVTKSGWFKKSFADSDGNRVVNIYDKEGKLSAAYANYKDGRRMFEKKLTPSKNEKFAEMTIKYPDGKIEFSKNINFKDDYFDEMTTKYPDGTVEFYKAANSVGKWDEMTRKNPDGTTEFCRNTNSNKDDWEEKTVTSKDGKKTYYKANKKKEWCEVLKSDLKK